ncbi:MULTISPECIES: hypothetical protein [unclassified Microbacterium]|nr:MULTISPECIES: hypothetical protein [unclassified Microbacterium]MCR2786062.1 hypothetical protein [Microbacterium sp. zg.B96]MDL5353094.1 hypothetical protein [Microbacterium sp. zg-YB36]WIM17569.1 hypothetical protein QNO11_04990 [Microbacterium sp. zg-B96]
MDAAPEHPDPEQPQPREDLLSALEVIEDQPLDERAQGYAALHDELARRLQSGPADPSSV